MPFQVGAYLAKKRGWYLIFIPEDLEMMIFERAKAKGINMGKAVSEYLLELHILQREVR